MGYSEDDAVHKKSNKMKTHLPIESAEIFGISLF